jgi:hypothetical protein
VTSTSQLTHYGIQAKRGSESTQAIGILPRFTGVSVHDGWAPYRTLTTCRHALCSIHHLRELMFLEEEYTQGWAKELKGLLLDMKAAVEQVRIHGLQLLPTAVRQTFVARYEALLAAGLAASPPPQRSGRRRGRIKQLPARNLLERIWLNRDAVLAFLSDLTIPFDNNQAERDLRGLKIQQKVSGCFRSEWEPRPTRRSAASCGKQCGKECAAGRMDAADPTSRAPSQPAASRPLCTWAVGTARNQRVAGSRRAGWHTSCMTASPAHGQSASALSRGGWRKRMWWRRMHAWSRSAGDGKWG